MSENDNKQKNQTHSGTGALSSIIFLVVVVIFMIILAHFKG